VAPLDLLERQMRRKVTPWLAFAAAVFLAACTSSPTSRSPGSGATLAAHECTANRSAGTLTYVSPFGFDASVGILDVFVANKLGYFSQMCLDVSLVTDSQQPTELVSSGRATVSGIGSAADDLAQVSQGADVVGVATYGAVSDYALLTQPSITNLKQLEGKTLAYHSTLPLMIMEMLRASGVDLSKVHTVDTQDYDPGQLAQGREDALQAYQSNEPLTLRSEGVHFREFVPSQFGIKGTFNVEIFNKGFLEAHRSAARDFVRAQLHAFDYCSTHEARCISIEQQYAQSQGAEYMVSHETEVWKLEVALARSHTVAGEGVGVQTQGEWQPEATALRQYGLVNSVPSLNEWEDTSLVKSLYDRRSLVWP
jgi:ABC-type nitrate/sulfonate/bicarbonate transport system substrate-binding protein